MPVVCVSPPVRPPKGTHYEFRSIRPDRRRSNPPSSAARRRPQLRCKFDGVMSRQHIQLPLSQSRRTSILAGVGTSASVRAFCTCIDGAHDIFDVDRRPWGGLDFEAAKLRVAEILGQQDLIKQGGGVPHHACPTHAHACTRWAKMLEKARVLRSKRKSDRARVQPGGRTPRRLCWRLSGCRWNSSYRMGCAIFTYQACAGDQYPVLRSRWWRSGHTVPHRP